MKKKQKLSAYSLATALLVVGIVILVNVVSANLFGRLDLTQGRIYSLSDASKKIADDLQDTFTVKAYFSKNLPAPHNGTAKYVQDLLADYKTYSKGKIEYQFVDPGDDTKLEQEAQKYRIPALQAEVMEEDQFQVRKVYMGLVFLYKDRQEVLPMVGNTAGLEYDITSTIRKMTSDKQELPAVGFLSGHEEPGMEALQTVQQVFAKQYRMRPVSVANGARVPDDITVLIIASPRRDLSEWEKYAVDQYIMKGGKTAFLIDKVDVNLQYQQAQPAQLPGLDDWTRNYGFVVRNDLVGDGQNPGILNISQQEGFFQMMSRVPYPFIPSLRDFDKTNVMVKGLERVGLYFASSIDTSAASGKSLRVEPLIRTSQKTMLQERTFDINPLQKWTPEQFDKGQQIVAVVLQGSFASAFAGKPVPAASDTGTTAPVPAAAKLDKSPDTRIVVVGDGEFFADQKGGADPDNRTFFQNLVDWLAQDEALIAIRSREVTDRPLKTLSTPSKRLVKYANMLGSPLLVVLLGIGVWQARKRRKIEI